MTLSLFNHPDLVAAYRYPLDARATRGIASVADEYPDHRLEVHGDFLFILENQP